MSLHFLWHHCIYKNINKSVVSLIFDIITNDKYIVFVIYAMLTVLGVYGFPIAHLGGRDVIKREDSNV